MTVLPEPSGSPAPQQIGDYRLVGKLGEGGMGVVFEARHVETDVPVALKIVRLGRAADEATLRLFQREADVLARLRHPSIATIHAAGHTDEGHHYMAMELVRGEHLDRYVRERRAAARLTREEMRFRLTLFLRICEAIIYAHQRGVIHRDLKPSNIMVVEAGESAASRTVVRLGASIKVLDFGLARMTDADLASVTLVSEADQVRGTLNYMSPEQARGHSEDIDLRTDIYSMGVILYELLSGVLPHDVRHQTLPEAVQIICEEEPRRLGEREDVLRGDIETIVGKALAKDPARRYQTIVAFYDDIERALAGQPILARPPSVAYQLGKLIGRHKGAFAFVMTVLLLLTGFAATMSVMFQTQRRERLRADAQRQEVERINAELRDLLTQMQTETVVSPSASSNPVATGLPPGRPPETSNGSSQSLMATAGSEPPEVDPPRQEARRTPAPTRRPPARPAASPPPSPSTATPPSTLRAEPEAANERTIEEPAPAAASSDAFWQSRSSLTQARLHVIMREYPEAERLLMQTFTLLQSVPDSREHQLEVIEELVTLYDVSGEPAKSARYRRMLGTLRNTGPASRGMWSLIINELQRQAGQKP